MAFQAPCSHAGRTCAPEQHSLQCHNAFSSHSVQQQRRGRQQQHASVIASMHSSHRRGQTPLRAVAEAPLRAVAQEAQHSIPAGFSSISEALEDVAAGRFVVVTDDANRENEGDLIMAAELMTPERMAFMVEHTSGIVCVGMEGADLDRLQLPLMVPTRENEEAMTTAFTITVDLKEGTSTGVSASDRSKTCVALADSTLPPEALNRPGHIFPLRARPGGVLTRRGHTEAAVDLARLAGCFPAGVLCEILDRRDGEMARTPLLLEFAQQHGLKVITIDDLAHYVQQQLHSQLPLPLSSDFNGSSASSSNGHA